MRTLKLFPFLFVGLILLSSWGFHAHRIINNRATFTLPASIALYYKKHIEEITERSIDADKRVYVDSNEAVRHYIDIENFGEEDIDSIPIHWSRATDRYQQRKLLTIGIIPWQISFTYNNLVKAFQNKDHKKIMRYSADLGHYVADAHVPLHTTKNYNGQLTNQIGIHAFWESRLPEMFAHEYDYIVGKAEYIDDVLDKAWYIVKESHSMVDSVLKVEKLLSKTIPPNQQKSYLERNNILIYTYSDIYAEAYHDALNGMVERRMSSAVHNVGSYWYSAWVDAGQPDLSSLATKKAPLTSDSLRNDTPFGNPLGREEWH